MKPKSLLVLAGIGASLILSGAASADVSLIAVKKDFTGFENFVSMVVNVYVLFDGTNSTTNFIVHVGGLPGEEGNVSIRDGIFFQVRPPFGGVLAPNPGFFEFAPELVVDTYLTIGRKTGPQDPPHPPNDGTQLTPFFPGEDGTPSSEGVWTTTRLQLNDGAWFVNPDRLQGRVNNGKAGSPNGINTVLIGQFSVAAGAGPNAGVFGTLRVQGSNAGAAFALLLSFDSQLPAPGSLALLGSAGLLGRRRRRR